jgi:hypothetical protein
MAFSAAFGLVLSSIIYAPSTSVAANNLQIKQVQTADLTAKAVFSLSKKKEIILKKYENSHSLNDKQLKELLWAVGFEGKKLKEAWAIAKKESNGRPFAFNGNTSTGDSSYGIFQINMLGILGPDRREKFELDHNADLFNPVLNAKIAFHMSNGGQNWSAWKGITPRTLELMKGFPL